MAFEFFFVVLGQHDGSICTPVISQVRIKIPAGTVPHTVTQQQL